MDQVEKTVLGIDLGGSGARTIAVKQNGTSLEPQASISSEFDCRELSSTELKKTLTVQIETLMKKVPNVEGIGISVPAMLQKDGTIKSERFKALEQFETTLADFIEKVSGKPCRAKIDSESGAEAEASFGSGKCFERFAYFTLGSGVGGATVEKGKAENRSFGYIAVNDRDIVEELANAAWVRSQTTGQIDARALHLLATAQDINAKNIFFNLGYSLGCAAVTVNNIWKPDAIVFGGNISLAFEHILPGILQSLSVIKRHPSAKFPALVAAKFGGKSSLYGAAILAL